MLSVCGSLKGKTVLVIGLGISGRSAARFLIKAGATVVGIDDHITTWDAVPEVASLVKERFVICNSTSSFDLAPDLVVVSPGIPPTHPFVVLSVKQKWEVIGEAELACRFLPNPMVGVTGTNGKTTVTMLTAHVLQQCGISAHAAGNAGTPLTAFLENGEKYQAKDVLVVELSSYQLETLDTKCLDAAALLNITPDHLDRYPNMEGYVAAKLRIRTCLKSGIPFYVEERTSVEYDIKGVETYGYSSDCCIYTDLKTVFFSGRPAFILPEMLQGRRSHEIDNLMAAFALCHGYSISGEQFIGAYHSFQKPAHRIEFVRLHCGVAYVDDSKGTNLDAVVKAVQSMQGKVILIVGGVHKGAGYFPWIEAFAGKVRHIFAIGQAAKKIEADLDKHITVRVCQSLKDAVHAAACVAEPGETVLLSPGCSSFDMFADYAQRGDEFKRLVQAL